jgi:hypothetical protein
MKQLTLDELVGMVDKGSLPRLNDARSLYGYAEAVVVFENQMLDSSRARERSFVLVGPSNTFPSVTACHGRWLNDLPSQRQHAITFWSINADSRAALNAYVMH